jgi:hypothetical protein
MFLAALTTMILIAAIVQPKPDELLLLQWAKKAQLPTPPVAILIEMGLKDTEPAEWHGKATVTGAKVVHREGYRFRADDKLIEPDGWQAKSHRPIRLPRNQPALARTEGIQTTGVVLHLAEVQPDARLTLDLHYDPPIKPEIPLKEVLSGRPVPVDPGGKAIVRLISTATPVVTAKTEDDFPAAAYGPDGTLWLAYISYHVKDESRRIEQKPLQEQPANFKAFYTPQFGDQLFVKYLKDGKWSEPIAVTGPKEDLMRCAVAVDISGTATVAYSANRNGDFDIFSRSIGPDGGLGPEQRVEPQARGGRNLAPSMCTDSEGKACLAYHRSENRKGQLLGETNVFRLRDDGRWGFVWGFGGQSGSWSPALVGAPRGQPAIAWDSIGNAGGDYDVEAWQIGTEARHFVAPGSKFEARPSICYDPTGRLWIAYEEGPERWGKDWGPFDPEGEPLYSSRSIRVVCLVDGKLMKPVAELPTSNAHKPDFRNGSPQEPNPGLKYERATRYAYPKIGIDGKGRVWLTYRQKFGSRYSTHPGSYWLTFARRLDGDKWSEPIELHHSCGLLDHRPVLLPYPAGGLIVFHNTDGRYTTPEQIDNQVYMSYVDFTEGNPGADAARLAEPKLVPHEPGKKNPRLVEEANYEREVVDRIRQYRVEANGKKYQLLRGEFHRHTEMSWDGGPDGSLEDMFRYAIDAARMDWIGNGDHDNGAGREYSWWLTQKLSDAYHVQGVFTPMFTYERSVPYPHGHRNVMFAQRGVRPLPRLAEPDMEKRVAGVHADDTKMLYRYLKELNGICAVHTSATGMGTDWRDSDPVVEPIVEIYQGDRMSYEYPDCPRAGFGPQSGKTPVQIGGWQPLGFLDNAMKVKGYRLGFQASSDHWSTHISYCIVLAEKHDRESILEAIKKRNVYGATDDIIVDFRSGSHIMGDEFKTTQPPKLEWTVIGTNEIAQIDILKDHEIVETIKPGAQEVRGAWTDPRPSPGVHYYYIRVMQTDGELAWASPMWISYAN